ncbi:hypothetical protein [Streptomyces sp. NPDC050704]|uniref:hypothetical protein n=1 Tax=Streptomyces sp. NPDC050704 TaxID=3157219 RepID=UPI003412B644
MNVIDRIRDLWARLHGNTPRYCHDCRRRIRGAYRSDMDAPVTRPIHRCWPDCPPT